MNVVAILLLTSVTAALAAESAIDTMGLAVWQIALGVFFFTTCGWIMGNFHVAIGYKSGDATTRAHIVQGFVASYVLGILGFWMVTIELHYSLLAGMGVCTLLAYLGLRAATMLGDLGLDGIKAIAQRFIASGGKKS